MTMMFSCSLVLSPCRTAHILQEWFEEHDEEFKVLPWPPNSKSAFVGYAGPTSLIHRSSTSQPTGLEGSAANIMVSDTTGNLQESCGVHALVGTVFGSIRQTNSSLCRWS